MPLAPGTKLGPYEILAPLGAGGMGEVYRARDTRLGRDVAVKVLPEHLSADPEIRTRFEREAKTVSSLNHPNICVLFDVGREGDIDYLVMELVEGGTLTERLGRGALSPAELLRIGSQVADALDRAHRAGVIHRDLKPGNIMLTKSGAKLMDFGLARAAGLAGPGVGSGASGATLPHSPSAGRPLTVEGAILGTFQYMSPEQLEGHEADARSDIWALGCVLYEMATGRRAFEGRSQASLIAAIIGRDPAPIPEVPSGSASAAIEGAAPQGLDRLVRNCLAKDPEERIQTAHDVKLHLRGIAEAAGMSASGMLAPQTPAPGSAAAAAAAVAAARQRRGSMLPWAVAALAVLAGAALTAWLYPRATAPKPIYRFRPDIAVPGSRDAYWPRVSPNGRYLVFDSVDSAGTPSAWIREMDEIVARPILGTAGLTRAYWSPDSREIAFVAEGKIQRVPITGGTPVIVCDAPGGADLSWGSKGVILMDGQATDSLRYVPAGGGELRPATRINRAAGELGHGWPCFLPDGEHFLYLAHGQSGDEGDICLGKLGSLDSKVLGKATGRIEYAPGGWILFPRGTTLLAQKLALGAGKLTGQPIPLVEELRVGDSRGHFSISTNGVFAFARTPTGETRSLYLADRRGMHTGAPLTSGTIWNPSFSPDARRLLIERRGAGGLRSGDIHVLDIARGTDTKLTFTDGRATTPEWSPDGRRFAWAMLPTTGPATLRIGAADGLGAQDSIAGPKRGLLFLSQWAGSQVVFNSGRGELGSVSSERDGRPYQWLIDSTQFAMLGQISPDGRWLAYMMGRPPNLQVFVQSIAGAPGRWQISSAGGFVPRWTRGGREIVFEGPDGRIMAVDIETATGFHAGTPRQLFTLPTRSTTGSTWTCDDRGERFALIVSPRAPSTGTIEVVTDFQSLVSRK